MEFYLFSILLVTVIVSIIDSTSWHKGIMNKIRNIRFLDGITFIVLTAYFIGYYLENYNG